MWRKLDNLMKSDTIVKYDKQWSDIYDKECYAIIKNQRDNFVEIHHIGSTAIYEIYAKPKIDIALIVKNLDESKRLEDIGYQYRGYFNIPFRYFYSKITKNICVQIHVLILGDPELEGFLAFRDYMNTHKEDREKYSELKLKIKALLDDGRNEQFLNKYTLAKNEFITSILRKAGFNGYCMRLVCHYTEQEYERSVYKYARNSDIRVIFYKGADIIGYANATTGGKINFFEVSENEEYFKNRFKLYLETLK